VLMRGQCVRLTTSPSSMIALLFFKFVINDETMELGTFCYFSYIAEPWYNGVCSVLDQFMKNI
jgi:hypothetical protein